MGAVWARVRAGLRRSLRSSIALALMIGLASAVVLASAAGARRTDSAYDRFREATHGFDVVTITCPDGAPWPTVDLDKVAALPMVEDSALAYITAGYMTDAGGRVMFYDQPSTDAGVVGAVDKADDSKLGAKLLSGRLPDPSAPNEVVVGYRAHQDPAVKVGNTINYHMIKSDADPQTVATDVDLPPDLFLPAIPMKIVGTVLLSGPGMEIAGDTVDILGTPAFYETYGSKGKVCQGLFVWTNRGLADANAFIQGVQQVTPSAVMFSAKDEATYAHRNIRLQAVILWLFAAAVAGAGLIIFGQALARQTTMGSTENPILRALGMTRPQLFGVAMLRALLVGALAAAVAVIVAILASPIFPTGLARLVEPTPGIRVDGTVLGGGGVFIVLAVLLIAAIPAWRAAGVRGDALGTAVLNEGRRPSVIAHAASQAGAPPSAVAGMRLALEPGRGRSAIPVRSAIVGLVLAIVALVASVTFAASFQHMLATPRLVGITFDAGAGNPFVHGQKTLRDTVRPLLSADPGLVNVAGGNFAHSVLLRGPGGDVATANIWGLEQIKGEQHPPEIEGRWPTADGEVALGAKTMDQIGARVGETVSLLAGGHAADLKIVGKAVFPDFGFGPGLGEGLGVTFTQFEKIFPGEDENLFLFDYAQGSDPAAVQQRVGPALHEFGADMAPGADAGGSQSLNPAKRGRSVPAVLASVLALMAIAMLAHTLVSSVRRRRRDLAILKTLGFTKGQVAASVAWQASTIVAISLLIGLPLGIAVGRWGWNVFANQLGVIPEPVVNVAPLLIAVPVTILLANLIAVLPGRAAARTVPASILRSE